MAEVNYQHNLAKTDAIDAESLACFGEAVKPEVRPLPQQSEQEIADMVARRRQIVGMLTAERNRLGRSNGQVRVDIEHHIAWLSKHLDEMDDALGTLIESSPIWGVNDELLRSVPGVGRVASSILLSQLPELWQDQSQADSLTCGCRATQQGQWAASRQALCVGRKGASAFSLVYGYSGGDALQSRDQELLHALVRCRQTEEGGSGGVYA